MSKPKERTICHASSALPKPHVSQIQKGFDSCSDRSQNVDYMGKSGKCNMCSAPCSSCFHMNQVLTKSTEEFAGETCAENIVIDNEMSTVDTMISTSDSSENAPCKGFSRTTDASVSNEMVVHVKFETQKIPDDCLSCDSGTNEATQGNTFHNRNVDGRNLPRSSVYTSSAPVQGCEYTIDGQTLSENGNDKSEVKHSAANHSRLSKINGEFYHKLPSSGLPIGLSSRHPGFSEALDSKSTDHGTDLLMVKDTSTLKYSLCDRNLRDMEEDNCSAPHGAHSEVSSERLNSLLTGDVVTDIRGDLPANAVNSAEKNVDVGVDMHLVDDNDDSDMVLQDVKVCDICGDAGREDLLAVCCRCIDGAEHTYCMREKMAKVPEGDWLCEECKSGEQMRSQRQDKIEKVDGNEKNISSGQAISEHVNSVDVEGNRSRSSVKIPNKRLRDDADAEASSIIKKPAVESMARLQKSSWSAKTAALSPENSLKNPDKGRVQSSPGGPSSDAVSVSDNPKLARPASDLRVHNFQGVFSRSNSFTSINSKPKVKLVDQVLRRQKSVKEVAPHQLKDGGIRSLDKSMLLKAKNSIGFESKTKMLSPRLSHIQDLKISKQQNTFERQSSFNSKHAPTNSIIDASMDYVSRSDKKQASGGERCQISTPSNHLETRSVQLDGKSAALLRSYSLSSRKSSYLPSSSGEFKRPALYGRNAHVVLSAKGVNNIDKNSDQSNSKADSSSCSGVSERSPFNADEDQHDGLSRPRESSNSGEPLKEQSGSCSRQSYVNSSWDENNNLKAAIQAAMLRKPGVYQKYRSDDSSTSNMGCDTASKDHLSSSAVRRIESSAAEVVDKCTLSQNLSVDTLGQETLNNTEHIPSEPVEASSGGDDSQILLDWKSSSRDMFSNDAAAMAIFSKSLAIPKHEYIWQGSFDIYRSGKMFVSWDGIQAHLSISTSPQVLNAVKKFKNRIVLYEVPRLSTWPIQFQERGVVEDNVALFFFAKDLESYNKIYKVWLENIIKNDLALKGNVNGVELLIFPSNQLPENSQRWNMLSYLWGVFRGKKESHLEYMPENGHSLSPRSRDFPTCDDVSPDPKLLASVEFCSLLSYGAAIDGDCDARVSSVDCLDGRLNSSSPTAARSFSGKQCQELRDTCPEEDIKLSSGPLQGRSPINVSGRKQMSMHIDTPLGSQHSSYHFDKSLAGVLNISADKGIQEATMLDKVRSSQDQMNLGVDGNNDAARSQLHGALGKMNHHVASGSLEMENQHHDEACNEIVIPRRSELPVEQSRPWEARSSEQNLLQDRLPDLELALGAKRKQKTRVIQQVMVDKQDRKLTEEYILDEAALREEDDVASALSLSLSYPLAKDE